MSRSFEEMEAEAFARHAMLPAWQLEDAERTGKLSAFFECTPEEDCILRDKPWQRACLSMNEQRTRICGFRIRARRVPPHADH